MSTALNESISDSPSAVGSTLVSLRRPKPGRIDDRLFEIEFLDPGVQVYAFTFG